MRRTTWGIVFSCFRYKRSISYSLTLFRSHDPHVLSKGSGLHRFLQRLLSTLIPQRSKSAFCFVTMTRFQLQSSSAQYRNECEMIFRVKGKIVCNMTSCKAFYGPYKLVRVYPSLNNSVLCVSCPSKVGHSWCL